MEAPNDLLKLVSVAKRIEVSEHTIRSWIRKKVLPARQIRKRWYIRKADLDKFLYQDQEKPTNDAP